MVLTLARCGLTAWHSEVGQYPDLSDCDPTSPLALADQRHLTKPIKKVIKSCQLNANILSTINSLAFCVCSPFILFTQSKMIVCTFTSGRSSIHFLSNFYTIH